MSIIRYGGTSGGYRAIKQFGRDPFLGYTLEDLAQLVKGAGGVLYLDARKADGVQKGVNAPFTNPLIDLDNSVGKNLFDVVQTPYQVLANTTYSIFGNGFTVNATSAVTFRMVQFELKLTPNATAYLKALSSRTGASGGGMIVYDSSNITIVGGSSTLNQNLSFTVPSDGIIRIRFHATGSTAEIGSATFTNIILSYEDIPYEPYKRNNALLTNFSATSQDGYTLEATVNSNGQAVGYSNLVVNPTFVDTSGWSATNAVLTSSSEKLVITGSGLSTGVRAIQDLNIKPSVSKRISVKARFRVTTTGSTRIQVFLRDGISGSFLDTKTVNTPVQNQWYESEFSIIATMPTLINNLHLFVSHDYVDAASSNGKIAELEKPQIIYITDNPQITAFETQLGKPLDAPACDRIFPFVATTGVTYVSARYYIATDGLDSLATIVNSSSMDIVGTGSFAYATGFITPTTLATGALYFDGNNGSVLADRKICPILVSDGSLTLTLEGTSITLASAGTIKPNTYCDIRIIRDLGVLKCTINGVETYSVANTTNLVTKTHKRLFAITTNVGGTTHGTYLKVFSSHEVLASGSDVSKLNGVLDKIVKDYK